MLAVVLEIKKIKKTVLAGVTGVFLLGARTFHLIAMELSQVVGNMLAVVLEI